MPRINGARPLQLQQWQGCSHKSNIGCTLSEGTDCCACADRRPHQESYEERDTGAIEGTGQHRWSYYCGACKAFWENRIRETRIRPSVSRIPVYPSASTPPPQPPPLLIPSTIPTLVSDPFDLTSRLHTAPSSTAAEVDSDSDSSEDFDSNERQINRRPAMDWPESDSPESPGIDFTRAPVEPFRDPIQRPLLVSEDPVRGVAPTRPRTWASLVSHTRRSPPEMDLPDRMDFSWQPHTTANSSSNNEEYEGLRRHRPPSIVDSSERENSNWGRHEHNRVRGGRASARGSARGGRGYGRGRLGAGEHGPTTPTREEGRGRQADVWDTDRESQYFTSSFYMMEQSRMMLEELSRMREIPARFIGDALIAEPSHPPQAPPYHPPPHPHHHLSTDTIRPRPRHHQPPPLPSSYNRHDELLLERARRITTAGIRGPPQARPRPQGLDENKERPPPLESEEMRLECDCKICYGQIADVLVMPCRHLVLCRWCADQMGIVKNAGKIIPPVECPICRTAVNDRIQVFRC